MIYQETWFITDGDRRQTYILTCVCIKCNVVQAQSWTLKDCQNKWNKIVDGTVLCSITNAIKQVKMFCVCYVLSVSVSVIYIFLDVYPYAFCYHLRTGNFRVVWVCHACIIRVLLQLHSIFILLATVYCDSSDGSDVMNKSSPTFTVVHMNVVHFTYALCSISLI